MDPWRLLGRAILMGVDALGAGTLTGALAFLAVPVLWVDEPFVLALAVGGVVAGVTLAASLALAGLGRRPFPATRTARAAYRRLPLWWP